MNEARKIAVVFLVVMAVGLLALAVEWFREKGRYWLLLMGAALVVFVMALSMLPVRAQEHQHPPEHAGLHQKFYRTWMRPDNRNISCCHDKDCAPAQSKLVNGRWQARNSDAEPWVDIPPSRIEHERDSPDGRSHLCKAGTLGNINVYCFLPANGS